MALIGSPTAFQDMPSFNSWVGTSLGLFAEGKPGEFDFFVCKDGRSLMPVAGYSNQFGLIKNTNSSSVTATTDMGGWLMVSGVELGQRSPKTIEITGSASSSGTVEVWADDLKTGKLIGKVPFSNSLGKMVTFKSVIKQIKGQHDIFLKFPSGNTQQLNLSSLQFKE